MSNMVFSNMVHFYDENSTQCEVNDLTPNSDQKRINIVVRPIYTVDKVFGDIATQFGYDSFDLVLQPKAENDQLIFLNDCRKQLIYSLTGFDKTTKNTLVLLPTGTWHGDTNKRYELKMAKPKTSNNSPTSPLATKPVQNCSSTTTTTTITSAVNSSRYKQFKTYLDGQKIDKTTINTSSSILTLDDEIDANNTIINSTVDSFNLSPMSDADQLSDDDLALGASASPTETEPMNSRIVITKEALYQKVCEKVPADRNCDDDPLEGPPYLSLAPLPLPPIVATTQTSGKGYVGLVNQAMTCYLNSLLQALYMTPEFRNALYRWENDNDSESKNIPFQLQKLFLNLQTSHKSAVETTDLTRSFGWDSTEAWQQHDIQELCRVMFDALEHKFKNTKQANLISNLYEGKMIDYVKCLECNTEKTRADTFLDIPLPVRPFGSNVAYGSIVEALRAFVQPETLDGNNQYFCEKCNKKCDAHKGLKFKNFPYVLTLHLKRFDFDYSTMHRIKLNDKVTFPQALNLTSFVNATDAETFASSQVTATTNGDYVLNGVNGNNTNNTEDCADTTDSGSAMEEDNCSSGIATTASSSQHENENDEDEGIDMSTSTDHRPINTTSNNEQQQKQEGSPYLYELFAIMIHSGSASGGHYYAYIKEFQNNEWFCFNDQSVAPITHEDIQKSFGGGATKAYYSSVYSSSTNAYMLMYRQIDPTRNERVISVLDFPAHINALLTKLHSEEETRIVGRIGRHSTVSDLALPELIKPRVYFYNPSLKKMKMTRVYVSRSFDIKSVLESAHQLLNVEQFAPLSCCRLVGFDSSSEDILQSFENVTDSSLAEIRASSEEPLDFLLEYYPAGQNFETYEVGGTTWHVYMVNLVTMEMDGPYLVHSSTYTCNDVLRHSIALRLFIKEDEFLLATLPRKIAFVAYDPAPTKEAQEHLLTVAKSQFRSITYFYVNVPNTDPANLEIIGIPPYEAQIPLLPTIEPGSDVVDAVLMNGGGGGGHSQTINCESPLPPNSTNVIGHESNSEDSSLSDGDRTLVESLQSRGAGGDSQFSSTSHSPQLSSPEDVSTLNSLERIQAFFSNPGQQYEQDLNTNSQNTRLFFHARKIETVDSSTNDTTTTTHHSAAVSSNEEVARKPAHTYKILVDSRMFQWALKRHIETLIRVPSNYFRLKRKNDTSDKLNSTDSLIYLSEGETLLVELGKVLQPDEQRAKIFYMRLSELEQQVENANNRLPCICEWIYNITTTAGEAKRQLIAKLHRIDAKYHTLTMDNCRLWLKGGRNPVKILDDDEILFNDVGSSLTAEFLIQECEDNVKPHTSEDSLTLFVRRWHADTLVFDKFQEITLEKNSEIKNTIAQITDIPEEQIAYSKINSAFPCTNISVLNVNSSMFWFTTPATLDKNPLTTTLNGNVLFYKDQNETPKELTYEERRELNAKEKTRLDRLGGTSTSLYSPRRERALKIYLDSPQAPSLNEIE